MAQIIRHWVHFCTKLCRRVGWVHVGLKGWGEEGGVGLWRLLGGGGGMAGGGGGGRIGACGL